MSDQRQRLNVAMSSSTAHSPRMNASAAEALGESIGGGVGDREQWVERELKFRAKEFTEEKKIAVYLGTWNVNGKKPKLEPDITDWLRINKKDHANEVDIYGFGFQEIVDLNAQNLLVDHNAADAWEERIGEALRGLVPSSAYVKLSSQHLVGLSLSIFVKKALVPHITDMQQDTVGVGIMGVAGNKGAVAVRFNVYNSSVVILNAHLAANLKSVKARNADYHSIVRRASFGPKIYANAGVGVLQYRREPERRDSTSGLSTAANANTPASTPVKATSSSSATSASSAFAPPQHQSSFSSTNSNSSNDSDSSSNPSGTTGSSGEKKKGGKYSELLGTLKQWGAQAREKVTVLAEKAQAAWEEKKAQRERDKETAALPQLRLLEHDYVFWIGDLNYRLNCFDLEEVYQHVENRDWKWLRSHDQLITEKRAGRAFKEFREGVIDFAPTYKFQPGTEIYERREDKKIRFPAWCDRIQWLKNKDVKQVFYRSSSRMLMSDHRAVSSLFEFPVKVVIGERKLALQRHLQQLPLAECIPQVTTSSTSVAFGEIQYGLSYSKAVSITNTGKAVVAFRFMSASQIEQQQKRAQQQQRAQQQRAQSQSQHQLQHQPSQQRLQQTLKPFAERDADNGDSGGNANANAANASGGGGAVWAEELGDDDDDSDSFRPVPWLSVQPEDGVIGLGETMHVSLNVHVSRDNGAKKLNSGEEDLDVVLIFRVENGSDKFVQIGGKYLRSCFGSSLYYLNRLICPMRDAPLYRNGLMLPPSAVYAVPKEVFRVLDRLIATPGALAHPATFEPLLTGAGAVAQTALGDDAAGALALNGGAGDGALVPTPGSPLFGEVEAIRDALDRGVDFHHAHVRTSSTTGGTTSASTASAAAYLWVLAGFLNALAEPVFPSTLTVIGMAGQRVPGAGDSDADDDDKDDFDSNSSGGHAKPRRPKRNKLEGVDGIDMGPWCKQALLELQPEHYQLFIYVVAFLREILKHPSNKVTPEHLAPVFGSCLTHCSPHSAFNVVQPNSPAQILYHFLTIP